MPLGKPSGKDQQILCPQRPTNLFIMNVAVGLTYFSSIFEGKVKGRFTIHYGSDQTNSYLQLIFLSHSHILISLILLNFIFYLCHPCQRRKTFWNSLIRGTVYHDVYMVIPAFLCVFALLLLFTFIYFKPAGRMLLPFICRSVTDKPSFAMPVSSDFCCSYCFHIYICLALYHQIRN